MDRDNPEEVSYDKKAKGRPRCGGARKEYPDALCSLEEKEPYRLLIAVRLSAQCTDARVNLVTPVLFERFPTLESLAFADVAEVEEIVHPCGFFRAKANDIVSMSRVLIENITPRCRTLSKSLSSYRESAERPRI